MNGCNLYDRALELQNLVNDAIDKGAEIAVRGSFGNLGEDAVDQFFPPTIPVNVNHNENYARRGKLELIYDSV